MPPSDYIRELRALIGNRVLLVPSVTALIRDDAGRVLLVRHIDTDRWVAPGGAIDPGETPSDAVVREAWEETGLVVSPERLAGVFAGPKFVVRYPNGDEAAYVMTVFECAVVGGALAADGEETSAAAFFSPDALPAPLAPWVRVMLDAMPFVAPRWTPPA